MKFLLDEQLDEVVALSMAPIAAKFGDEFTHILASREQGTPDEEIPAVCREEGAQCLVTANVRDFGARKLYYQALLAEGLHVAVLRPGKGKFYEEEQLALLSQDSHDHSFRDRPAPSCLHRVRGPASIHR